MAPSFGGMDISSSIVTEARIVREILDKGLIQEADLDFWIGLIPEDSRPAFLEALDALGINH
jgi:hypothetical protein